MQMKWSCKDHTSPGRSCCSVVDPFGLDPSSTNWDVLYFFQRFLDHVWATVMFLMYHLSMDSEIMAYINSSLQIPKWD